MCITVKSAFWHFERGCGKGCSGKILKRWGSISWVKSLCSPIGKAGQWQFWLSTWLDYEIHRVVKHTPGYVCDGVFHLEDLQGSDLIGGLIPWWIPNTMALLRAVKGRRQERAGTVSGGVSLGHSSPWLLPVSSFFFLCFLVTILWTPPCLPVLPTRMNWHL